MAHPSPSTAWRHLAQRASSTAFICLLLGLTLETVWAGSIAPYLSFRALLIAVIVTALLGFHEPHRDLLTSERSPRRSLRWIPLVSSVVVVGLVWYETRSFGALSYLFAVVAGAVTLLLPLTAADGEGPSD